MTTFIDEVRIFVKGGDGGRGCVSFRREKYVPRGGPNGGDGGKGGDILFQATSQLHTLLDLRYHQEYRAPRGSHGKGKNQHGRDGISIVIRVPMGTVVKDPEIGTLLTDLDAEGKTYLAAQGGRGGKGNAHFATATHRTPRFAQPGEPGEERWLRLELKLLADVGLVGLPNAGKSTLLSRISAARPKIADYPFTTLTPHLGVVRAGEERSFVAADIPGLIEGAHAGAGLGHQFLRHVERTKLLLHLVDVSEGAAEDPVIQFQLITRELALHNPELGAKPQWVVATKIDAEGDGRRRKALAAYCRRKGIPFHAISAVTGKGVRTLLRAVAEWLVPYDVPQRGTRHRTGPASSQGGIPDG